MPWSYPSRESGMVEGEIEKAAIRLDQMLPVRNASLSFGAI